MLGTKTHLENDRKPYDGFDGVWRQGDCDLHILCTLGHARNSKGRSTRAFELCEVCLVTVTLMNPSREQNYIVSTILTIRTFDSAEVYTEKSYRCRDRAVI